VLATDRAVTHRPNDKRRNGLLKQTGKITSYWILIKR